VRPFLAGADIAVAPLEIARGVQNKVLEAMAMAQPVLLSQEAATGIDAVDGRDFAIAQDDQAMIERALAMLADGPETLILAASARRYVLEHQSWDAMMQPLAGICGIGPGGVSRDAA
jgi:glycosyltransferase involved in cell wall biosynthesis